MSSTSPAHPGAPCQAGAPSETDAPSHPGAPSKPPAPHKASAEHSPAEHLTFDESVTKRVALASLVGTALEWYDFFLFTTASALVFNIQYFTSKDPVVAGLASFGALAVGFVARPIGGLVFGVMGDRIGRKKVLMITVLGIGTVTGLIGLLPNYAAIGVAAPILLILLRVLQGFAVGGEWSGAITIAVENAPPKKRGRYAALPQVGSPIGTILSSGGFALLAAVLSKDSFDAWGWRIPFLAAIPLLGVSLWLRAKLSESPEFEAILEEGETSSSPLKGTLAQQWRQILVGAATAFLGVGGFYLVTTFVVFYGTAVLKLDRGLMLTATIVASVFEIGILILGGRLAERFGGMRVVIGGGLLTALLAFPVFLAVESKAPALVILGMTVAVCSLSIPYAVSGAVLTGLFPTRLRNTGVSVSSNLAGLLSGFVPMAATATLHASGNSWVPSAWILVGIALLTTVSGFAIPRLSVDEPGRKH